MMHMVNSLAQRPWCYWGTVSAGATCDELTPKHCVNASHLRQNQQSDPFVQQWRAALLVYSAVEGSASWSVDSSGQRQRLEQCDWGTLG